MSELLPLKKDRSEKLDFSVQFFWMMSEDVVIADEALNPICRLQRIECGDAGTMRMFHHCVRKDSR